MKYTLEQRVFMLEKYIKYKSFQEFCVAFVQKYPDVKLPRKSVVRRLVAKFRETGSLLDETEEGDKGQSKGLVRNKLQTIRKTSRSLTAQRESNGPVTRARRRDIFVSGDDTETHQEAAPFTFVGIKHEVEEDVDGEGGSGSDVQGCCDEAQLVTVKSEPSDTSSSGSPDGDSRQEPLTCVNIKQEDEVGVGVGAFLPTLTPPKIPSDSDRDSTVLVSSELLEEQAEDDAYVIGMQSDLGDGNYHHSEALQVPTAASGCETRESEGMQQQDMFASVKVEGEEAK